MSQDVTVVICTRNRPALVRSAVESILAGNVTPREIVVADQSEDASEDLESLSPAVVRHLRLGGSGLSRARNAGVAAAQGSVVAFVDDDVVVGAGWLPALTQPLARGGRIATTGRVLVGEAETENPLAPSSVLAAEPAEFAGRLRRDVLAGGNMAVPRKAFDEVGLFDERLGAGAPYPAADDNDFGYRMLEAGYRILYVPDAAVYHRAWRAGTEYRRLRFGYGVGQGGFYAKHASVRDTHVLRRFGAHLVRRIALLPVRAFYDRRRLVGDIAFLGGLLAGFARWLATERRRRPPLAQ